MFNSQKIFNKGRYHNEENSNRVNVPDQYWYSPDFFSLSRSVFPKIFNFEKIPHHFERLFEEYKLRGKVGNFYNTNAI